MRVITYSILSVLLFGCIRKECEFENKTLRIKSLMFKNTPILIYEKSTTGKIINNNKYSSIFLENNNIFITKYGHEKINGEYKIYSNNSDTYLKINCSDSIFCDDFKIDLVKKDTLLDGQISCKYSKLFLKSKKTTIEFHEIIQCNETL